MASQIPAKATSNINISPSDYDNVPAIFIALLIAQDGIRLIHRYIIVKI